MDQHELIGLIAPRPFLLIGGDEFDKKESWYYINAARAVYELSGAGKNIGYFNHHTGHTPSPEAVSVAFDWLDHFLEALRRRCANWNRLLQSRRNDDT